MTDLTDLEVEAVGVGDVRMVRTFRIGPAGQLYPVNSIDAWVDGWNTARCGRGKTHAPPGPNCRCGFYLYSDAAYALAQPPARQVMESWPPTEPWKSGAAAPGHPEHEWRPFGWGRGSATS